MVADVSVAFFKSHKKGSAFTTVTCFLNRERILVCCLGAIHKQQRPMILIGWLSDPVLWRESLRSVVASNVSHD